MIHLKHKKVSVEEEKENLGFVWIVDLVGVFSETSGFHPNTIFSPLEIEQVRNSCQQTIKMRIWVHTVPLGLGN